MTNRSIKAIITVGLGFGDESKGATVDHLTRKLGAKLVVRYCGGAQAGHNVVTSDGQRHTFSQFGAGTFAGANTFLDRCMILNPGTMVPEAEHLKQLGIADPWGTLIVHPDCLVATTYHMLLNRLREKARGAGRHGSCGLGIGETRHYSLSFPSDAIRAIDLKHKALLCEKLEILRERFLGQLQWLDHVDSEIAKELTDWSPSEEALALFEVGSQLRMDRMPPLCDVIIFEGSQGVLLDESYGFHPYTTWSTVTPQHAQEFISEMISKASVQGEQLRCDVQVLGLTRAYSTRHGAGPFPSYCSQLSKQLRDAGNPANLWQGAIRFGALDLVLLEYAARIARVDGLIVSHLDEYSHSLRVVSRYQGTPRLDVPQSQDDQLSLTKSLETAKPIEERCNQAELMERLESIASVVGLGFGPSAADREYWEMGR